MRSRGVYTVNFFKTPVYTKKCPEYTQGTIAGGSGIIHTPKTTMRGRPGSPYALAWARVVADIRAQNPDKSEDEIREIALKVQYDFSPNWKTYKYTK